MCSGVFYILVPEILQTPECVKSSYCSSCLPSNITGSEQKSQNNSSSCFWCSCFKGNGVKPAAKNNTIDANKSTDFINRRKSLSPLPSTRSSAMGLERNPSPTPKLKHQVQTVVNANRFVNVKPKINKNLKTPKPGGKVVTNDENKSIFTKDGKLKPLSVIVTSADVDSTVASRPTNIDKKVLTTIPTAKPKTTQLQVPGVSKDAKQLSSPSKDIKEVQKPKTKLREKTHTIINISRLTGSSSSVRDKQKGKTQRKQTRKKKWKCCECLDIKKIKESLKSYICCSRCKCNWFKGMCHKPRFYKVGSKGMVNISDMSRNWKHIIHMLK